MPPSPEPGRANAAPGLCAHCGSPCEPGERFCCTGCEAVAGLLAQANLARYYDLAPATQAPVGPPPAAGTHAWLEPLVAAAASQGELASLELDVQGLRCAACVWLMTETFRRRTGSSAGLTVNPALGKVRVVWRPGATDVGAWVTDVERFGYRFGPSRKHAQASRSRLALRLGLCAALTMNAMILSLSFYFGLSRSDGTLYRLFTLVSVVLSTGVVVIGGSPFISAAAAGLRRRVLHLDLPIALGILLVYATSLVQLARGAGGDLTYLDTLATFITLMLLGRWLQERVLERNRRMLLDDDGADAVFVRRLDESGAPVAVAAPRVRAGDRLLVAPGELVPVDADLVDDAAAVSTDWITGEPTPQAIAAGGLVPAGSLNAGRAAFVACARTAFSDSPLVALLRQPRPRATGGAWERFWDALARRWVVQVLAAATAGLLLWWPRGAGRAIDVAASLLVVTCPCAIGLALPLAYELTQARLRRAGFFVRTGDLLDRLERVRTLVFDKTGTLTLGRLVVANEPALTALDPEARDVAYTLAARSGHPVSAALAASLARAGARFRAELRSTEVPGQGVTAGPWRLGRAGWAGAAATNDPATVLARDGVAIACFSVGERLRPGARAELGALRAAGYDVQLLSGDAPVRVAALADELGIARTSARGGLHPEDKAVAVRALDAGRADTLYLGDGLNDALAFEAAACAGTVAIDRPVLPGKADFFLTSEGLAPLAIALTAARQLRTVARRTLRLSLAYNVVAVSTCLAGLMTPLRAAISMPASSLGVLLFVTLSLRERARRSAVPVLAEVAA